MKKLWTLALALLCLGGCAAPTFEQTMDVYAPENLTPAEYTLKLPEEAAALTLNSEGKRYYFCDGFDVSVEVLSGGDLNKTVQSLTGFQADQLCFMKTERQGVAREECTWVSAGENGDQVSRVVILDDGRFHYCLCLTADNAEVGSLQDCWQEIASSFALKTTE